MKKELVSILSDLIAMPSPYPPGTSVEICAYAANRLRKAGYKVEIAAKSNLTKKAGAEILEHIATLAYKHAKNTFTLPGIGKLVLVNRPSRTMTMQFGFGNRQRNMSSGCGMRLVIAAFILIITLVETYSCFQNQEDVVAGPLDFTDRLRDPVRIGEGIVDRIPKLLHQVF